MPFTSTQQQRLDAAQKRLDTARANWKLAVASWDKYFISITCYSAQKYDAVAAATWFTPNNSSCTEAGSCSHQQKKECKDAIYFARTISVPALRAAYPELDAAQKNYDKVFAEVTAQVQNDPEFILQQQEITANASANRLKWIFWISVSAIVIIGGYVWYKFMRK